MKIKCFDMICASKQVVFVASLRVCILMKIGLIIFVSYLFKRYKKKVNRIEKLE